MRTQANMARRLLACGVAGVAIVAAGQVVAADANPVPPTVQEVVVTANKKAEKLHDVAMAVTAATGRDMELRQETDFHDFSAQIPGFQVVESSPVFNREVLRGQNSGGAGSTVSTLIDDVPLSFSGSDNDAALASTNLDTYDLQRVEVLKGPQGTLYGATAEGGVVKYVTNAPDVRQFGAGLEAGVYNVDHGQTSGSVKGFLNLPFWDGKAALRITGYQEGIAGYIDNPLLGQNAVNSGFKQGGRVSLLVKPTSDLSIRLTVSQQDIRAGGADQVQVNGNAGLAQPDPGNAFSLANGYNDATYNPQTQKSVLSNYAATIDYDLHWAKITSITSYGTVKASFVNDVSFVNLAPGVDYQDYFQSAFGTPMALRERQLESLNKSNQELRLASEPGAELFGHKLEWVVGAYATREDVTFNQALDLTSLGTPSSPAAVLTSLPAAGSAILPSRYAEWAVFGQVDYHFLPNFDVAVGARTSQNQEGVHEVFTCCILYGSGGGVSEVKHNEDATTWSVAPRWQINRDTVLYARIATGYRPGGPNLVIPGAPAGYPYTYGSDSTVNYEVGLRTYLLNRTIDIDLSAYYIDWKNIQIETDYYSQTTQQNYTVTSNVGTALSQGLEWNLGWTPIHDLRFGMIGAYMDAHLTESAAQLTGARGDALPYVPLWSNTLNADYAWPAFAGYQAFVGGSWVFTGARYSGFAPSGGAIESHVKLPAYDQFNLQAGLRNGRYTFEVYGHNLGDARGISSYGNQGGFNQTGVASIIRPRTIGMLLSATF